MKLYLKHWNGNYREDYFAIKSVIVTNADTKTVCVELQSGSFETVEYDEVILEIEE